MSEKKFFMGEAIRFGWDTMKKNIWFLIVLIIVAGLIENLPGFVGGIVKERFPFISYMLYFSGWLLGFVVQMGLIKVSLNYCDGLKVELDDLLSTFSLLISFLAGSVLYFMIILAGLVLFIIPGFIWGVKYSLFAYFIVDKGMGPLEALKESGKATKGTKWDLFLFGLLLGLINIAGFLCFIVGLLATIPTSMIAYAYVYRKLSGTAPEEISGGRMYINMGI